jgi:hypothetical protein
MKRLLFIIIPVLLAGCSPVPFSILKDPPTNELPPEGYVKVASHEFTLESDRPPTDSVNTCQVWGVNHIHRLNGGMYNPDGTVVPPDDPRNYCEWNPDQVQWNEWGGLSLVTDLNPGEGKTPIVSGCIATLTNYDPPVYVAARIKVAPDGGTYWTSLVSFSPNGWQPENDIAEFESSDSKAYTVSMHRLNPDGSNNMIATKKFRFHYDLSDDFHVYAADIQVDRIIIYMDNVKIWEYSEPGLNDEPIYFVVGNGIFQNADPDLMTPEEKKRLFPMAAHVDYLRIYQP